MVTFCEKGKKEPENYYIKKGTSQNTNHFHEKKRRLTELVLLSRGHL